jgi:rhamnosyltransferase
VDDEAGHTVVMRTEKSPRQEKICGVVVTYFPPDGMKSRLSKIAKHVDLLLVVDNSASDKVSSLLVAAAAEIGAQLLLNSYNLGIAKALNQGVEFARANGATWVVFFDQDSEPNSDFRSEFDDIYSAYAEGEPLGVIGSNYFLSGHAVARYPTESPDGKNYMPITSVITSGSAYAMAMLSRLGPFKDDYFIDCVDTEYCWRARTNGYAVCITIKPLVTHTIGTPTRHKVLGRDMTTWNHSAFRRYFIGRNNILLFQEYFYRLPADCFDLLGYVLKTAMKICVVEQERRKKLSYLLLGIWHGMLRRRDGNPWEAHR